jgi:regulator of protease activity HflC (stomatin/prohibitin superfamily)
MDFTNRNQLSEGILGDVQEAASGYGIAILRADVKDLVFPGNLQEIMNRVLATERLSEAQLVEARTKAEREAIEAQSRAETDRVAAVARRETELVKAEGRDPAPAGGGGRHRPAPARRRRGSVRRPPGPAART